MKKVYILAYSKMNLGDDLFVDILINRYKNIMFYSHAIDTKSDIYIKNNNINFMDKNLEQLLVDDLSDFSAFVYIGGSIFMEKAGGIERIEKLNKLVLKCKNSNIPFFYISCNFGPFNTNEYKQLVEDMFKNTTDTCFRDMTSYNMFKDIKNIRYAPDVVFSYNKEENSKQLNTLGVSVINFKYRESQKNYEKKYYTILINTILNFLKHEKEVTLFSFCKYEGDEETIDYILQKLPNQYKSKVKIINYDGNLNKFLDIYSKMEYVICSRFHSMILSYIFNQKKYVISYSEKIDNVIDDLKISDNIFHIEQLNEKNIINIDEFEHKKINNEIKIMAEKQFYILDKYLNC